MISGCGYGVHPCKYYHVKDGEEVEVSYEDALNVPRGEILSVCQDCGGIYFGIR